MGAHIILLVLSGGSSNVKSGGTHKHSQTLTFLQNGKEWTTVLRTSIVNNKQMTMACQTLHYSIFLYFYSIFFIAIVYFFLFVSNPCSLLLNIFIFVFNICSVLLYDFFLFVCLFVFILYSIICIQYLFISILYVSFLFYIRSFVFNN